MSRKGGLKSFDNTIEGWSKIQLVDAIRKESDRLKIVDGIIEEYKQRAMDLGYTSKDAEENNFKHEQHTRYGNVIADYIDQKQRIHKRMGQLVTELSKR